MLSLTLQLKHIGRDRKIVGVENRFAAFQERRCLHLDSQHKYHLSVIASSPKSIPNLLIIRIEGVVIRKPHFRFGLRIRVHAYRWVWLPLMFAGGAMAFVPGILATATAVAIIAVGARVHVLTRFIVAGQPGM